MASEQDARAALDRWQEGRSYVQYSVKYADSVNEESAFLAGYEAGHDELRDKILKVVSSLVPIGEAAYAIIKKTLE